MPTDSSNAHPSTNPLKRDPDMSTKSGGNTPPPEEATTGHEVAPVSDSSSATAAHAVDFTWENLTYKVPVEDSKGNIVYKTLLYSLSGCALSGRVLAIMGPSGAGKTTLMGAITGKLFNSTAVMEGMCFMNNNVYQQAYKRLVSYVCQDDIAMGKDTPKEALIFSARLRLGLSLKEAEERTERVLARLSLTKCKDTYLGIAGVIKGVSGGEKKRANIGTELITNPFVMLLDEPTTGLDSVNAVRVGQLMQDLAKNDSRTVIATVHSPSSELIDLFDDLLLLAKGHTIYHGPSSAAPDYFAALGYAIPELMNPTEYYMTLLQLPDNLLSQLWLAWEDYVVSEDSAENPCLRTVQGPISMTDPYLDEQVKLKGANYWTQFRDLFLRSWRMYLRDPGQFVGRAFQVLFFGTFLGLFFFNVKLDESGVQDRQGALYITLMNNMFGSTMVGIASFPPERAVFLQEQSNDAYNAFVYFLAKSTAELPWQVLFPTIFECISYFMIHFYRSAGAFLVNWFTIVLLSTLGSSLGLMFATFFETAQPVFALVPNVFLPLLIVSGMFANTERLYPYWEWLLYLSFPRQAYLGVFTNEFSHLDVICNPVTPTCRYANGDAVISAMGFEGWHFWQTFVALIVYQMGLRVIGGLSLYVQGNKRRGKLPFARNLHLRHANPHAVAMAAKDGLLTPAARTPLDSIATPRLSSEGQYE